MELKKYSISFSQKYSINHWTWDQGVDVAWEDSSNWTSVVLLSKLASYQTNHRRKSLMKTPRHIPEKTFDRILKLHVFISVKTLRRPKEHSVFLLWKADQDEGRLSEVITYKRLSGPNFSPRQALSCSSHLQQWRQTETETEGGAWDTWDFTWLLKTNNTWEQIVHVFAVSDRFHVWHWKPCPCTSLAWTMNK